ncbi:Phosphotransferase enzyme family [Arthrobacter agilis]|uniref:phosphotransferase n=1 Tax=Arthrobacter agilis TaxID=37921 RepID=UPI000F6D10DB|nr:phosphotransferase [Arthrobacter agilis]VDR32240.1 Phosphotransferase enzyme family [Arthrobacter agilis]
MTAVPDTVQDHRGIQLTVRRAWPANNGRLTIEALEEATGHLRAGHLEADGTVALTPFGEDSALPGLPTAVDAGELLVHRFTKRAVVKTDGAYLKLLPPRKVARVIAAHAMASELTAAAGITTPRVTDVDEGTLTLSTVPGVSLHDLGRSGGGDPGDDLVTLERAWSLWAEHWSAFAAAPPGEGRLPFYRPEDEAETLTTWMTHCLDFGTLPVPAPALRSAVDDAANHLLDTSLQAPVLSHRDLHDKQVLLSTGSTGEGGLGLIDCDTLALAEPALDLANLLVHLAFREAQGLLSAEGRAVGETAIRGVAEELSVPEDRLDAYSGSTKLRLACVYAFRPRWRMLTRDWFHDALL